jgi:hypothetical protein
MRSAEHRDGFPAVRRLLARLPRLAKHHSVDARDDVDAVRGDADLKDQTLPLEILSSELVERRTERFERGENPARIVRSRLDPYYRGPS